MNKDAVAEMSQQYQIEAAEKVVPEGYKQTEVGVIPEDWLVLALGKLGTFKNGINKGADDFGHGLPFVNLMDVFGKPAISNAEHLGLINSTELDRKEYSLEVGDVLFIRSSVKPSGVGLTSVVLKSLINTVYSGFLIRFRSSESLSVKFKKFCFYEEDFRKRIVSGSTVSANTNINQDALKAIPLAFPRSIKEQDAIANALSDTDALLSELEKLIAKKQAIKTATMQQLLTGRTRLPQFAHHPDGSKKGYKQSELGEIPEDWEVVKFGDIGKPIIGLTYSPTDVTDSGTLVLRSSNIQKGRLEYKDNVFVDMELPDRVITQEGDILICVRNGSRQLIGKCALIDKKAAGTAFGAFMSVFRTEFYKFVFYQFQSDDIKNQIEEMMGATINQITNKDMSDLIVAMPSCSSEQTAIATILSDMDEEIQALEQRLNKTRQIKQGMMQQLLTGKVRLV